MILRVIITQNRHHKFKPVDDINYECEFCGIDAYYDLDPKTKKYPLCTYSKLLEVPRVFRHKQSTLFYKIRKIFCDI